MRQEEFQKILKKHKKGLCTPEEEAFIEKWFQSMGSSEDPSLPESEKTEIKKRSWTRVQDHIVHSKVKDTEQITQQRTQRINPGTVWAIAAAISIVMVSAVFLIVRRQPGNVQAVALQVAEKNISNHTEGVMEVLLNDGSHVFLKPKSRISFREPFNHSQRLVALEGEAFFKVSRDTLRPFLVNTNEVITKVLGTSFTVSAFPDEDNITVSVVTGKVSVTTKKGKHAASGSLEETILTPNQKIIYNKNKNVVSRAIVSQPVPILPAEVVKRMHFEAAPISKIFEGLEQVYGVDIEFDEHVFSSCILTTSIAEGSIYNRLDMICKAIDAHYVLRENQIVITGAGCKQ